MKVPSPTSHTKPPGALHLVPAACAETFQVDRATAIAVRRWRRARAELALLKLARRLEGSHDSRVA